MRRMAWIHQYHNHGIRQLVTLLVQFAHVDQWLVSIGNSTHKQKKQEMLMKYCGIADGKVCV